MELALAIGAFVVITALIALCTFWFFHLHRRYLVVADNCIVSTAAEDEHYSPAHLTSRPCVSGENRGKKLLLSTSMLDDGANRPQHAAPNRQKPQKKESANSDRTGAEPEEKGVEAKLLLVVVQEGAAEQPRTEQQLMMEEQFDPGQQQRIQEQPGTKAIDRNAEKGGEETGPSAVMPACFQPTKEEKGEKASFKKKRGRGGKTGSDVCAT